MRGRRIIRIKRVGDVPSEVLFQVSSALEKVYPLRTVIDPSREEPPIHTFDWKRLQYVASSFTLEFSKNKSEKELLLLIADVDAYEDNLNFVFGIAMPSLSAASVFLKRLYPDDGNMNKFLSRTRKEAVHEVGHLLGLGHCINKKCVMSFSNSVFEVDYKGENLCEKRRSVLKED